MDIFSCSEKKVRHLLTFCFFTFLFGLSAYSQDSFNVLQTEKVICNDGNAVCSFSYMDTDRSPSTFEVLCFTYHQLADEDSFFDLSGIVFAICPERGTFGYKIVYYEFIDGKLDEEMKLCSVDDTLGTYILNALKKKSNHKAISEVTEEDLKEVFSATDVILTKDISIVKL